MERIAIYMTLLISIYVLYLTMRYKTKKCVYPEDKKTENEEPIRVSEIFKTMFSDPEPRPGHINL